MAFLESTNTRYVLIYFHYVILRLLGERVSYRSDRLLIAEWAMGRLQAEGAQKLDAMRRDGRGRKKSLSSNREEGPTKQGPKVYTDQVTLDTTSSQLPPLTIRKYRCSWKHLHGNLCLNTDGLAFETLLISNEKWSVRFDELETVQKVGIPRSISAMKISLALLILRHLQCLLNSDYR